MSIKRTIEMVLSLLVTSLLLKNYSGFFNM